MTSPGLAARSAVMGGCEGQVAVSGEGTEQCVLPVQGSSCKVGRSVAELVLHDLHVRSKQRVPVQLSAHAQAELGVVPGQPAMGGTQVTDVHVESCRPPGLAGAVVMTRCHTITAIPRLRRSGRLPCGHRGQERGVAPCQVRDAYLVAAGLIELLAELVAVAVVEDSLEHLVAGGLER